MGETTPCRRRRSGRALGLTAEQVERVYRDIDQKRRSTRYLHLSARLVGEVEVPV